MDFHYKGQVVKTFPKRAYYSELIWANQNPYFLRTSLLLGFKKTTAELWKGRTEKYAVRNQNLVQIPRPDYLASEERWIIFNKEHNVAFPVSTFKPKVQMLDDVEPKTLPRRVEIERRRRLFMAQDLKKLLEEANISKIELIPPKAMDDFLYSMETLNLFSNIHFLPLELFDDNEYDCRTPEDWLLQGLVDGVIYPMPGEAFLPLIDMYNKLIANLDQDNFDPKLIEDLFEWQQVSINEYDAEKDLYHVVPLNNPDFMMDIPRIYLEFKAEDPKNFVCRIKNAIEERKKCENIIKYQAYLDCLILPGIDGIPVEEMERISTIGTQNNKVLGTKVNSIFRIQQEMNYLFKRTQGEFVFRKVIEDNPSIFSSFIKLPPVRESMVFKAKRFINTEMVDFHGTKAFIEWVNIYVLSESYQTIYLAAKECASLDSKCLFNLHYGRNVTLEEFNSIQRNHIKNMCEFLKGPWKETIQTNTKMCLRDVGKGDFNMNVVGYNVFFKMKIYRMLELIKFRMEDALVFLTERSLTLYTTRISDPCICTLGVSQSFVWGDDLVNTQFNPSAPPVFLVTLKLNETDPYYSTEPHKYEPTVLQLFNSACSGSHEIEWITPEIMTKIVFDPTVRLSSIGLLNPIVVLLRTRLEVGLRTAIIPLKAYLLEYYQHVPFYNLDLEEYVRKFEQEDHPSIEVKEEISMQYRLRRQLEMTLPDKIFIGPFIVLVEPTKKFLIDKRTELILRLLEMYAIRMRKKTDDILSEYEQNYKKLMVDPISIEHIFELRDWIETLPMVVKGLDDMMRVYMLEYEVLDYFWYILSDEDFKAKWDGIIWPYKIRITTNDRLLFYETETERLLKMQVENENALHERIDGLTAQVTNISQICDIDRVHEMAIEVRRMFKAMLECHEQGQLLCMRQKLFGVTVVPWDDLTKLMKEFEPFRNLWITASDWLKMKEIWFENPLVNIDSENIIKTVQDYSKSINKAVRTFQDIQGMRLISEGIRDQIDEFKPLVPIIIALRNPGIKERHWEAFAEETGIYVEYSEMLTFSQCLEMGVQNFEEELQEMSDAANKEYAIELALLKMQKEWNYLFFDVQDYKQTGTYIIKVGEEIELLLDEQLLMTQQIAFSPFKAALEKEINEWEWKLKTTQLVLEQWEECQKTWMYLEPIFSSEDISSQLPFESKKFGTMERNWKRIMKMAKDCPKIMTICPDKRLLEALRECNHLLDIVQHGLSEYLEMKRTGFPRLYFLSDDELLDILAQARYPVAVQPYLKKCFENIHHLQFEEDLKITKMYSSEGECIKLIPHMYPTGGVECWLSEVEATMRSTIRETFAKGIENYVKVSREKWVLSWPGQIVIAGSQTFWTAQVEQSIANKKMSQYFKTMLQQLDVLRTLVKGELNRIDRESISALIVIEVHARDVLDNLIREKVKDVNDFEWISQLRYYWVGVDEAYDLRIRAVTAEFIYGYEYLGNSGRLVITPLTDRCYLTLTGALHLKFGGAPAGPAGTGKTETTKDLAKALAYQCVVFNCSDQLDYMAMGKFFKGLASSGAWACFDEFNRIDIEVLSVIAQQVITIQKAQIAKLDRFFFEGVEIALKPSCAVFITMNPGYAGRTELPDNLKALFRPVAMMVPNYALIAEISLFSYGFSEAKELAGKIVTTFKLSSEQLSTQDHYDFGMRAVKTVIAVAGNLKRENPQMDERQICLRALRAVNMPKFLTDDLKLFNGIVSDLFPRLIEQVVDYGILEEAIRKTIIRWDLEDVNEYVHKVIELYETTVVRHGLMLVGPTGSGKTKCYMILQESMTYIKGKPTPAGVPFVPVRTYILNPKSITMGQLYGEFNLLTHEWTDGILPSLMRESVVIENDDKKWFIFDGPVDAVWIESMNTVLDDNKKLCLTSGEIIKMTPEMTMMFEVADLAVASPATVSRCGMIYLEPSVLGLQPFINCWAKRIPETAQYLKGELLKVLGIYLLPALKYLRSNLIEIVRSVDSALVLSFLRMMDIRLGPLVGADGKPPPSMEFMELMDDLVIPWVVFSVIWTIGATCDHESRPLFSDWIRQTMKKNKHKMEFPKEGLVYDYNLHDGGFRDPIEDNEPRPPKWVHWMAKIPEYVINPDMKYLNIEVPTIDNVRSSFLIGMLLQNDVNILAVGPTGTCKTQTIKSKLSTGMLKKYVCEFIIFSARTSANQTQELIDSKLDKRKKDTYGPPPFRKMVFFIDDFNMPALEVYGAQPPIELIRQWMDFKGWYDLKEVGSFRNIIDVSFICSMGPPGGGRNVVTMRLLRHFHYLTFVLLDFASKKTIFKQILASWINRTPSLQEHCDKIVDQTIIVFDTILKELLPTPAKTHYTFNLRDLSKVFQGILMVNPTDVLELDYLLRIWYHENCRIFQDRLINDEDRLWFGNLLENKIQTGYNLDPKQVIGDPPMLFGDFINPNIEPRPYMQITDMQELNFMLNKYLADYNRTYSTSQMRLVLFEDAISHLCRIARIIRQPQGNALLLGMGGSGRQSLTRLAAHINECYLFQIELTKSFSMSDWRDALKDLMLRAGLKFIETVFLFSDNQIKMESFLEDLNNILNSGDVPNIYKPDEIDNILVGMRQLAQEMDLTPTKSNLFNVFTKTVRTMLHTVITMSPLGEIFRARLRQFPALVNCCTIDWFCPWPKSALESVALQFLLDIPALEVSDEKMHCMVMMCENMHQTVADASDRYLQELSRHNYVTPTSYLELLRTYQVLLEFKKNELTTNAKRLSTGLNKLLTTSEEVKELQIVLATMRPELEKAAAEAQVMLDKIALDTQKSEETKKIVEIEEEAAQVMAQECEEIAADAQQDLDEAMPLLMAAEESLKSLNKNDISEVRSMKRPPEGVVYVIESICIVKGIGANVKGKVDYWELGRNMLSNAQGFLDSLVHYDKESLTEATINKLKVYVENPAFEPKKIIKVSKACTSLCMWVHAIYKYYFVFKAVEPKRIALNEAKEKLEKTQKALNEAKERIRKLEEGLAILLEKLRITMEHKQDLEDRKDLCLARMVRAVQLVDGLADERVRWSLIVEGLNDEVKTLIGDVLLSAGAVAYLTPFTFNYRKDLMDNWTKYLKDLEIPHSSHCSVAQTLGDPVLIRNWQVDGLPRDALSTENAILISNSRRWPLFIDPQCQANRWIKNMQKNNGLLITKLIEKNMIRSLESAIRFGKPCLIENVDEELDPALDPILLKQIFVHNGQTVLKLGESVIPYNEDFKLYITTKLANPHYSPEVSIKVSVVNFTVVPSGLSDQLLGLVVMEERPELEEARSQIIVSTAQMRSDIKEIEDKILYKLSVSEGSPVDDIDLIETLKASKIKSEEIQVKMAAAEITQKDIDETRMLYVPVANRAQILYFCVADLANIDPMYQYSLEWFITIFVGTINIAEKTAHIDERVNNINETFTYSMYSNVCRSLFEKHKLLFAFLLCVRIQMDENLIDPESWKFLMSGGSYEESHPNPDPSWISEKCWNDILSLQSLKSFKKLVRTFGDHLDIYKRVFDSPRPHDEELPYKFDYFERIIILKCLRTDKVKNSIQMYIKENLGLRFIEPQSSDLTFMYKESSPTMPLLFVLSPGTDPAADLYKFADKMKMSKRLFVISLGQGQGPRAEAMLLQAIEEGSWVYFQNCHLAPSWMPRLDRLIETIDPEESHKEFRVWLTSIPSPFFPVAILQNGSKMTVEPPRGIKANLLRAYTNQVIDFYDFMESEHEKVPTFKLLLFSLCLFHGSILERRKFGPLGFNIPYEFTDGDLRICISQLHMFLLEYDTIPYKVLTYTAGHINYGGRVTDDWDRRCIMNILYDYYTSDVVDENYEFFEGTMYHQLPNDTLFEDFMDYLRSLPINDEPILFGLHDNANISYSQNEVYTLLSTLLNLQPKQSGGAASSQEEVQMNSANTILATLPSLFKIDAISLKYPVLYRESLNTVLIQETIRFNKLIMVIDRSLKDLISALKGLVVMSAELEEMAHSLYNNTLPNLWAGKAYPSLKPLASWVTDLKKRINFLNNWIQQGIPTVFWISGFFFPQAFLTGTLQNYARKYVVSIDSINFNYTVLSQKPKERPKDGACISGLFLEGCRWDYNNLVLNESKPKQLYTNKFIDE